jgi:pilus assembly protein CpaE
MLTAGIVIGDSMSAGPLLAALQQTGLIGGVKQWLLATDRLPEGGEPIPDVIVLDLGRDPEPFFAFGTYVRRLKPSVRVIACSSVFPPSHQLLLDAMRNGVQDFIPKPVEALALKEILARLTHEGIMPERRGNEKLIFVMGAKGGVGATTVAVNLGVQLATYARKKVVLLDVARPLGNVHLLLDLHPRFTIRDAVDSLDRLDTHFFSGLLTAHKTKLEILGGATQAEEWENIPVAPIERVVNVAQSNYDIVLADMGSQFGSDWGPMMQSARMVLLVAEANVPSLWTLQRRITALGGFGVDQDRIRVVINRWHRGDEEALKTIEKEIKRPIFAYLPNDFRKASMSVNLGTPLMENHNNTLTNRYRQLASQLTGMETAPSQKKSGLSNFLFPTKR